MIESISIFGNDVSLYYLCWFLAVIVTIVVGCYYGKSFGFTYSKSIIIIVLITLSGYFLVWATSLVVGGGTFQGMNYVRIVSPLIISIWLVAFVFKDRFSSFADYTAPLTALNFGIMRIGCIFPGCCQGYPSEYGIYSNVAGGVCFPIQIIEIATVLLISALLFMMQRKKHQKGLLYFWYMLFFGSTRFLLEFLRDNEKIWHGVSELAFHALGAAVIGSVALTIVNLHRHRRSHGYEEDE